jgi:hypothetical protein
VFGGPALAGKVSVVVTELKDAMVPRATGNGVLLAVITRVVPIAVVSTAVLIVVALAVVPPLLVTLIVNT